MSKIEWITAPQIEVGGSARPDSVTDEHGIQNSVAIITLTNRHSGDAVVIEGRPEHLLNLARAQLRVAEQIVEATMRDPQLRSMYGLTAHVGTVEFIAEARALGADDGAVARVMLDERAPQVGAVGEEDRG